MQAQPNADTLTLPTLYHYQRRLVADPARDVPVVSATQVGKTAALSAWLLGKMWSSTGPHPWWWVAPTYVGTVPGQRTLWQLAKSSKIIRAGPYPPFRSAPPPPLVLTNGQVCEFRTWDDPAHLMGPTIAGAVVDEAGQLTEYAQSAISTRRSATFGPVRYIGNPGPLGGTFYRLCELAQSQSNVLGMDGRRRYGFHRWTWRDKMAAMSAERAAEYGSFIEDERSRLASYMFRQMYEAEWADWNDLPVYTFDRAVHVNAEHSGYQPELPIELSCDFNVDPMCWTLGQHKGDLAWEFGEIMIPGSATTGDACREFVRRFPRETVVVYGDATGKARDTRSKRSDYDIIAEMLGDGRRRLSFDVPARNPPVTSRVNAFNSLLKSASGDVRYYLSPDCKTLADDLARVSWKPGTREIDGRNKQLTHASSAAGYRLSRLFPIVLVGPTYTSRAIRHVDPIMEAVF